MLIGYILLIVSYADEILTENVYKQMKKRFQAELPGGFKAEIFKSQRLVAFGIVVYAVFITLNFRRPVMNT